MVNNVTVIVGQTPDSWKEADGIP